MYYITIGIGGMIGSILRYVLSRLLSSAMSPFPIGTLAANLIGSFLLGLFTSRLLERKVLPPYILSGIGTGLIGSFTTFSTFSVETVQLIKEGHLFLAFIYIVISFAGGLILAYSGYKIGEKSVVKKG
jgi:CrcB protein